MKSCSVAGYELLICMFFIIVDDNCRCSSIPNFIVSLCGKLLTRHLLFVLCSKSNQLAQISNLQSNFVLLFVKRHYVLQLVQVFLRFSLHIYFCRNFSL